MDLDLSELLKAWVFKPGQINARIVEGHDKEPKLQVRLDLGILQMEVDGRPDGQRPNGFTSLLEYHESRADEAEEGDEGEPDPERSKEDEEEFRLSNDEFQELRDEAIQYYHRYVALLALQDFDRVVRDTSRNLRVLDLCARYAETDEDRSNLEQLRPYITMVRARALASGFLRDNEPKAALLAIDDGLETLRQYYEASGQPKAFEAADEVKMLRTLRETLAPKLPVTQKAELRQRLQAAIEQENYELAAILRDELRTLEEGGRDKPEIKPGGADRPAGEKGFDKGGPPGSGLF